MSYRLLARRAPQLYAHGLDGVGYDDVQDAAVRFVQADKSQLLPFAVPLFERLAELDIGAYVISGAPVEVIQAYRSHLPIEKVWATTVSRSDGEYRPKLRFSPANKEAKSRILARIRESVQPVLAVGDSVADLPLLRGARARIVVDNVDLPIAVNGTLHVSSASETSAKVVDEFLDDVLG